MAIARVLQYEGDNTTFIWKSPYENFNNMTEIIVKENQEAVFVANGQAVDTFGPGRYRLNSENIPVLSKLINMVTGTSVFQSQVYFINKTVQMAVKWGTDSKVRFVEPTLGVPVEIGASGEMNLAVSDGRKMLIKLLGIGKGIEWEEDHRKFAKSLQMSFRPLISTVVKSNLSATIKQKQIDIVEIDEHLEELSEALREKIAAGFEEYGLTVPQFFVNNVVLPEEDANFRRIRELHTVTLQKRMAAAEAEIKAAQREAILEGQITETEIARREAERRLIQAQAEAQAAQMAGMAEAAVMQAKGYTQKDVLQAEVQKSYAEGIGNMGPAITAGGGNSVIGDMMGLGVGMAAMGAMAPQVSEMMKGFMVLPQGVTEVKKENFKIENSESVGVCSHCGKPLLPNAKFCMGCGQKVEVLADNEMFCPGCGKKTLKGKFCMECGQPLVRKCPNCGSDISQTGKFCMECGTKL